MLMLILSEILFCHSLEKVKTLTLQKFKLSFESLPLQQQLHSLFFPFAGGAVATLVGGLLLAFHTSGIGHSP
jgi:hypothetical protein